MAASTTLDEAVALLAGAGLGLASGVTLFQGQLPDTPDAAVALIEYGGLPPEPALGGAATNIEFPRFQVLLRHTDWTTGRLLLARIAAAFAGVVNQSISGTRWLACTAVNEPLQDRDQNHRWEWRQSFEAMKAPSPTV